MGLPARVRRVHGLGTHATAIIAQVAALPQDKDTLMTTAFATAIAPPPVANATKTDLIKVLHVVNGEHYAGTAKVQDLLAEHLPARGYKVGFACVKPDRFPIERRVTSSELYNTPMKSRFDVLPAWMLARLVKEHGYKLLHSHTPRSLMVAAVASKLAGVPLVHHVHSQTNTEVGQQLQSRVNAWLEKTCCRRASKVIAVSNSIADYMRKTGFDENKIQVVPNGVPGRWTSRAPHPPTRSETWNIGMVALLRPRKGLEVLFEALRELIVRNLPVRLRVVGRFETPLYRAECLRLAENMGIGRYIDWVGFSSQVDAELARMHCLVLPSVLPEGLPMVLIEAMASGVPIVGSDVDGIRDVITHEKNGMFAEPGDAESLADSLQHVLSDELGWLNMQRECVDDHHEWFSERSMADGISAIYDEVLRNPRSSNGGR